MKSTFKWVAMTLMAALLTSPMVVARELEKWEWYVRLTIASDTGLKDRGNVIGQLDDAILEADRHDLRELAAAFSPYLSIVFYHPEWGLSVVDYTSDYHPTTRNKGDNWIFEVRSDDAWRDLTLSWEGQSVDMERMVLVDLSTDEIIPAVVDGALGDYSFNMGGLTRAGLPVGVVVEKGTVKRQEGRAQGSGQRSSKLGFRLCCQRLAAAGLASRRRRISKSSITPGPIPGLIESFQLLGSDPVSELWGAEDYSHLWVKKPIMEILTEKFISMNKYPNIKPGQEFSGYN